MIGIAGPLLGALLALASAQDPAAQPVQDVQPPASPEKPASAPEPAATPEAAPVVHPPPALEFTKTFDHGAYEAALGGLAEAYPDFMRVRSLGKSRGGRDLWLAVVADTAAEEPRKHPAAIVVTDLARRPSGEVAGPEAALFVLERLLDRARNEPQVRDRFRRSALYFLPANDPDHAFPASPVATSPAASESGSVPAALAAVRLEENFPARWLPFGAEVIAPGPYALSEPESLTLARFLLERENLSTLVVLERPDANAAAGATGPGSLRAYAEEILDLAVRDARPWTGAARSTPIGTAPEGFEGAAALALDALDALPRLECGSPKIERLRPDLWLLDLPLENGGLLSTLGGDGHRAGIPGVSMQVTGGRVVACALREPGSDGYRALAGGHELVPVGHLDGREALGVRLVLQADEGAALSVSFRSARAGSVGVDASLR